MSNSVFRRGYYKNTVPARSARVRSTNTTTNVNANTTFTVIQMNGASDWVETGFSISGNGIAVEEAGRYNFKANLAITSITNLVFIDAVFAVNGTPRNSYATSSPIYPTNATNRSSVMVEDDMVLNAGDVVTVMTRRNGPAGTTTLIADSSWMKISREAVVGLLKDEAKKTVWLWGEESTLLSNNTYDMSFGDGREGDAGHGLIIPSNGRIKKMTFNSTVGTALCTIEVVINEALTGVILTVPANADSAVYNLPTPKEVLAGQKINFRTNASGSRQRVVLCIELELD